MKSEQYDHMKKHLELLTKLSLEMNTLLNGEKAVLDSGNNSEIIELASKKKICVTSLETQTRSFHQYLLNIPLKNGLYGLSDFFQGHLSEENTTLDKNWLSIQKTTEDNKRLNNLNGSILELNRLYVKRSLEALQGQLTTSSKTYGADGQTEKNIISRHFSIA